jgi:putative sterol carrier protein
MAMAVDVKKLFNEDLKGALERNPAEARKIGGIYQINIAGAGSWAIDLSKDPPSVTEGTTSNAQATIDIAEQDFQTLHANPQAEGMKLFFAGKLKVKGNQMLAMNLPKLFALK